MLLSAAAASESPTAGGAVEEDIALACVIAAFFMLVLMLGGLGHRANLVPVIGWFERFAKRISGQPGWASMPCGWRSSR